MEKKKCYERTTKLKIYTFHVDKIELTRGNILIFFFSHVVISFIVRQQNMRTEPVTSAEHTVAHSTPELRHDTALVPSVITQTRLVLVLFAAFRAHERFPYVTLVVDEKRS